MDELPFDRSLWPKVVQDLGLCPQQARVVELLMQGLADKEIASVLELAEPTVRTYLDRIFTQLGVRGRIKLVLHVTKTAWRHRK